MHISALHYTVSHFLSLSRNHIFLNLYHPHSCITTDREWAWVVCLSHLLIRAVGVKKYARTEPLQVQSTWRRDTKWQKTEKYKYFTAFCNSFLVYVGLHRDVSLHTLFTMSVCMCVCVCGSVEVKSQKWTDKHKAYSQRVTLENKYVSLPALLVKLLKQLAQHTILCSPLQSTGLSGLLNTNPAGY